MKHQSVVHTYKPVTLKELNELLTKISSKETHQRRQEIWEAYKQDLANTIKKLTQ